MNLTGPKAVFKSVFTRASRTSLGVMLFARFRASATTYIAAYASAPWYSVSEPYFFRKLEAYSLAGERKRIHPQGRGVHAVRRVARALGELGEREPGPAADEHLGVDPQLLRLAHQQGGVHDVGNHVDHVGVRRPS